VHWRTEIVRQLKRARVGLICLTRENLVSPWLLCEVGPLSSTLKDSFLCTYPFQLDREDLNDALAQFQWTKAEKDNTKKLLHTINRAFREPIKNKVFDNAFVKWWPDLEKTPPRNLHHGTFPMQAGERGTPGESPPRVGPKHEPRGSATA
jgi:hypothetical protein